ncbi:hypothetical protein M2R49_03685 [Citrobacter amalonaticus]|uniref:hypothetical protein n=1 Tax=Citrobacter amalonaticus TaxID=35703 RepID=UPI0021E4D473|nr:hypothetical protein [Citrobacter amalonaticus]UYF56294.1 hypothetical protein M2R49_03685 [Citrobacter amalonaticus]
MRYVSINGAVFIFLQRGEKLKENEGLPLNGFPDRRYVLWPRGDYWDVREKVFQFGGMSWEPIASEPFPDESAAWLTAYAHWMGVLGVQPSHKSQYSCDTFATLISIK